MYKKSVRLDISDKQFHSYLNPGWDMWEKYCIIKMIGKWNNYLPSEWKEFRNICEKDKESLFSALVDI